MRVLGSYTIVLLLEGSGNYRDARGYERSIQPGDLIIIFPELGHHYGPGPGERWTEFYVMFDGPAFDLWRRAGLLDATQPVHALGPAEHWLDQLEATLQPAALTPGGRMHELSRFFTVLTDKQTHAGPLQDRPPEPDWLSQACARLAADLDQPLDPASVAQAVGLPYETFRKRFQRATGVSPARFRSIRRIDAACVLLYSPTQTISAIAQKLGFSDEYHFSRRFKQITGLAPREFRRRLPQRQA
jgi:AraC-like DNA-binding protein